MFVHLRTDSLTGTPAAGFCVGYSENNIISYVTPSCVYIYELQISPYNKSAALQFVVSTIHPIKALNTNITSVSELNDELSSDGASYSWKPEMPWWFTDPDLNPRLLSEDVARSFKRAVWSAIGSAGVGRCLLATLTTDNRVNLWDKTEDDWVSVGDLSSAWKDFISRHDETPPQQGPPQLSEALFKSKMWALMDLCWSHLLSNQDSLLFVGSKSGHVCIWRVFQTTDDYQYCIVNTINTNLQTISALHWFPLPDDQGLLFVGGINGQCRAYVCCVDAAEDISVSLSEACYPWDESDCIRVSRICCYSFGQNLVLMLAKQAFLIACLMKYQNGTLTLIQKFHTYLNCVEITGITKHRESNMLWVSQRTGGLIQLQCEVTSTSVQLNKAKTVTDLTTKNYHTFALNSSKNMLIYVLCQSLGVPYDHLGIRKPSQLVFFSELPPLSDCICYVLRQNRMNESLEYLEAIRIQMRESDQSDVIPCFTLDESTVKLQLVRWMLMCLSTKQTDHQSVQCENITITLLRRQHVKTLSKWNKCKVRDEQTKALTLLSTWMRTVTEMKDSRFDDDDSKELCPVCGEDVVDITIDGWRRSSCHNGHSLPRCVRSLLIISSSKFLQCPGCRAYAKVDDVLEVGSHCPLCDCILSFGKT